ncbi:glycoside hydrolase, partial [Meredithblackwellia eburnea MCA 4105]
LSCSGWDGSLYFSTLVGDDSNRKSFIKSLKEFSDTHNFDGVDIDWEYPGQAGIGCNRFSKNDSANYLSFLSLLRTAFGKNKTLTAAVATTGIIGSNGAALANLSKFGVYLDFINLMTVRVPGPWMKTTGPNSPLKACGADSSVQAAVKLWTDAGFPASKILVGTPSYGQSFNTNSSRLVTTTLTDGQTTKLFQPQTGIIPKGSNNDEYSVEPDVCGTPGTGWSGQWTYKTLISDGVLSESGMKGLNGFTRYWDHCSSTPFLFNPTVRNFITYEDRQSAAAKAKFVKDRGLGGIMVFDSDGFDESVYLEIEKTLATN